MRVQVLVAAMNQKDHSLLKKMNIQSDVIVGNQCDRNSVEEFDYDGHSAVYINSTERGVGRNRNNVLVRANADICLFADDDMVYEDGYVEKIVRAFEENPKADVIVFNLNEPNAKSEKRYVIPKVMRLNRFNYLRYGCARIAVRLEKIRKNEIWFNESFGGGTEHAAGEDNIFLSECMDNKLEMYAVPVVMATLTEERESTWANVDTEKYIRDKGCLFRVISKRWWRFLCLQDAVRHHKRYGWTFRKTYRVMVNGESGKNN